MVNDLRQAKSLVAALAKEAHRAKDELRAPGHPRPYFVSYLVRDVEQYTFAARFGGLLADEHRRGRRCFADVRVGSHRSDHVREGGLDDNSSKSEAFVYTTLPWGRSEDALTHGLWQLTEARYREAAEELLEKRAEQLHFQDPNRGLAAFERRPPVEHLECEPFPEVDRERWARFVEAASAVGKRLPGVFGSEVELTVRHTRRYFVSTEGAVIVDQKALWQLTCLLDYGNDVGVTVPWNINYFVTGPDELPSRAALEREIRAAFRTMEAISRGHTLRAYSGPVLLDPGPAGLLMHEALGHRLEGNRLLCSGEGQTFRDSLGTELLPPTLSMWDDPRLTELDGQKLVGSYRFDDEGVPATRADLVERGTIRGYLTSRAAIGPRHRSNGHARNESVERPMSRMGVTVVEAEHPVDDEALVRLLLDEVRERRLPFGVHVLLADSGETATKSYDFQAFLGQIRAAQKVFPDGRREWLRDVNFVGTPLNAIRGVVAAGRRRIVDNSYCGAESGAVPVSTVCPALLVSSLEMQSSARSPHAPHTYALPWVKR